MRLKTKILLLLVLCLLCVNSKCLKKIFGGGGGGTDCSRVCCASCVVGERYSIIYRDGCSRDLQDVPCFAGSLTFPRDCFGGCDAFVRQQRFFGFSFTASPSSADLNNPPSSVTLYGPGIDATYGMPRVEYFDGDGYMIGTTYASSVAGDYSSVTAPVPDLSGAWSGTYSIQVTNKTWEGFYVDILGSATMSCWGRDRYDLDGDGWYTDQECNDTDARVYPGAPPDCTGMYEDANCNGMWDVVEYYCTGGGGGGGDPCYETNPDMPAMPCYNTY